MSSFKVSTDEKEVQELGKWVRSRARRFRRDLKKRLGSLDNIGLRTVDTIMEGIAGGALLGLNKTATPDEIKAITDTVQIKEISEEGRRELLTTARVMSRLGVLRPSVIAKATGVSVPYVSRVLSGSITPNKGKYNAVLTAIFVARSLSGWSDWGE